MGFVETSYYEFLLGPHYEVLSRTWRGRIQSYTELSDYTSFSCYNKPIQLLGQYIVTSCFYSTAS